MEQGRMILKKVKGKSTLQRHPWIFSGVIESIKNKSENSNEVKLYNFDKEF